MEVLMKKLIQFSAVLSLMFVFAVVFANAQTTKRYAVNIPFDFHVGQKSYPAGEYHIRVARISADAVSFAIADGEKNNLQTVIIPRKGESAKNEPQLVFNRYKNQRFLSRLMTGENGYSMIKTDAERRAADLNTEVVSVRRKSKVS